MMFEECINQEFCQTLKVSRKFFLASLHHLAHKVAVSENSFDDFVFLGWDIEIYRDGDHLGENDCRADRWIVTDTPVYCWDLTGITGVR